MLTLYYSPGACSLGPHIFLREIDADFKLRQVRLADRENYSAEYRRINPLCRVPALKDGQFVLTEAQSILGYLAEEYKGMAYLPCDRQQRARAFETLAWLSSTVHIAFAQLWRPERFVLQREHWSAVSDHGAKLIPEHYELIERRLSTRDYITGSQYSVADAYLFVFYRWGGRIGIDMNDSYPNWSRWSQRLLERPAVQKAIDAEGITLFS